MAFPNVRIARDTFNESRGSALTRSEMESGPPKQARKQSRVMLTAKFTVMLFGSIEYDAFINWFVTDIKHGSLWFDWMHPRTRAIVQARFKAGEEMGEAIVRGVGFQVIYLPLTLEYWSA